MSKLVQKVRGRYPNFTPSDHGNQGNRHESFRNRKRRYPIEADHEYIGTCTLHLAEASQPEGVCLDGSS